MRALAVGRRVVEDQTHRSSVEDFGVDRVDRRRWRDCDAGNRSGHVRAQGIAALLGFTAGDDDRQACADGESCNGDNGFVHGVRRPARSFAQARDNLGRIALTRKLSVAGRDGLDLRPECNLDSGWNGDDDSAASALSFQLLAVSQQLFRSELCRAQLGGDLADG